MANESKMGLMAGLATVLVFAVVYYQKSPASANPASAPGWRGKSAPRPASLTAEGDPVLFPPQAEPPKDVLLRQ